MWAMWLVSAIAASGQEALARAEAALADFRPEEAAQILEEMRGPFEHALNVRRQEQLGIAHAYLGRAEPAVAAFRRMLALDPARVLPYTLSPKVTFLFERARSEAKDRPQPGLDLAWPRTSSTIDPIPVTVEVIGDPLGQFQSVRLLVRRRGDLSWHTHEIGLDGPERFVTLSIPPLAPGSTEDQFIELHGVVLDGQGSEVFLVASPQRPREIYVRYVRPEPWFEKWWVWVAAGALVAAGTTAGVVGATRGPPETVEGRFRVLP